MKGFDSAFLDDTPLPTKFRPQKLRSAYRAIDSVRRVNFQAGMRSYMAEQNLKTASAKSSGTNVSASSSVCIPCKEDQVTSTTPSKISTGIPVSSSASSNRQTDLSDLAVRSLPASRAVSSCDLFKQMLFRSKSNENLLEMKDKIALEKQFAQIQEQLCSVLGHPSTAEKELKALQLEISNVKSKFKCETKFLSLVVKALEGSVRKIPRRSIALTAATRDEGVENANTQESGDEVSHNLHVETEPAQAGDCDPSLVVEYI